MLRSPIVALKCESRSVILGAMLSFEGDFGTNSVGRSNTECHLAAKLVVPADDGVNETRLDADCQLLQRTMAGKGARSCRPPKNIGITMAATEIVVHLNFSVAPGAATLGMHDDVLIPVAF